MQKVSRRNISLVVCALFLMFSGFAAAQDYPAKPIRFVVAQTVGSGGDLVARIMGPEMSKSLGQPIVVENKPGAGNVIGYEYVARQVPADGYSVVVVVVPILVLLPVTVKDLRFDPLKDLFPVAGLVEGKSVMGSSAQKPWKTIAELVAYAKSNPGKLNYGSPAPLPRLQMAALLLDLGFDATHIPYSGAGAYFQALVAGEIDVGFTGEATSISFGDKYRPLAITGEKRSAMLPAVRTFGEMGLPQIASTGYTLSVRTGTPKAVVDVLYAAAMRALQQTEVKNYFAKIQLDIVPETPEAAARSLAQQAALFTETARKVGLRPE